MLAGVVPAALANLARSPSCKTEIKRKFKTMGEGVGEKVGLETAVFRLSS